MEKNNSFEIIDDELIMISSGDIQIINERNYPKIN